METERLDEAIEAFRDLVGRARELQSQKLLATAVCNNLFQLFAMKGDVDRAIPQARNTIPLLSAGCGTASISRKSGGGLGDYFRLREAFLQRSLPIGRRKTNSAKSE